MMELLIAACIIGLIPAFIAASKGQSFFGWWMYGAALFIVALPHSLLIQKDDWTRFTWGEAKTCPFCAELVRHEARICRFCGLEFPPVRQEDPETRQRLLDVSHGYGAEAEVARILAAKKQEPISEEELDRRFKKWQGKGR